MQRRLKLSGKTANCNLTGEPLSERDIGILRLNSRIVVTVLDLEQPSENNPALR